MKEYLSMALVLANICLLIKVSKLLLHASLLQSVKKSQNRVNVAETPHGLLACVNNKV